MSRHLTWMELFAANLCDHFDHGLVNDVIAQYGGAKQFTEEQYKYANDTTEHFASIKNVDGWTDTDSLNKFFVKHKENIVNLCKGQAALYGDCGLGGLIYERTGYDDAAFGLRSIDVIKADKIEENPNLLKALVLYAAAEIGHEYYRFWEFNSDEPDDGADDYVPE